jgi:hypothetical protein
MPVSQSTDKSDANTLPDPELNPLLNPLLAAHMGQWAEVYFTSPPEKRGEAVSKLLRELENSSPSEPSSVQVINDECEGKEAETAEAPILPSARLELVLTCPACAHGNSAEQRFCGACGAPLQAPTEARLPQVAEASPVAGGSWCERSPGENSAAYAIEPAASSTAAGQRRDGPEVTWPLPEKDLPGFVLESEPLPYRYRLYVGVVLAIFLAVLGYMRWRGKEVSQPSPPISYSQPAPANSAPIPGATASASPTSTPTASGVQNEVQPASSQKDRTAASRPSPRVVPVAASSSAAVAPEQSGAAELAIAEKYLNGNQGVTRNSAEAAQWLWKAVGKRNLAATLTLSDLYLRGDGVPKSCDQAHLLLDAAARKGVKAAAERLRNLQAFGCE